MKLEQNDKDTASENAKLKARVAKLEQKQLQPDKEKSNHIILRSNDRASSADAPASKSDDTTSIEMENSNDAPEQTNLHCDVSEARGYTIDTLAINISDNTSNSDVCHEPSSQYPS